MIDGIDISQIDPADLRKCFAYVPQDIHLFRGTIKNNILGSYRFVDDQWLLECSQTSTTDDVITSYSIHYTKLYDY